MFLVYTVRIPINYASLVTAAYAAQMAFLLVCFSRSRPVLSLGWSLIALTYGLIQTMTLLAASTTPTGTNALDILSALAKVLGVFLFCGLASGTCVSAGAWLTFLRLMLGLTFVAIAYNFFVHVSELPNISGAQSSYQFDFASFFANRNQFGLFLFISLFAHVLYIQSTKLRAWNAILFLTQFASLLLTMSRGSIAATLTFLCVLAASNWKRLPAQVALTIAGVLGAVVTVWKPASARLPYQFLVRSDVGLAGRDQLWRFGIEVWQSTNLLLGAGSFRGLSMAQQAGMGQEEFHSFFVELLVSGGLFELILVMGIFAYAMRRLKHAGRTGQSIANTYGAALVGLTLLGLVESIGFFTIGFVGSLFTVMFLTWPLMLSSTSFTGGNLVAGAQDAAPPDLVRQRAAAHLANEVREL